MVLINTYNSSLFTINSVRLVRNFIPLKAGANAITIVNAYDSKYQLLGSTSYTNISVNGTVYSNQTDLMNALSPILFVKQTAENSFSGNYNDLVGIPTEFPPSAHTHEIEDINGLDTLLNPTLDSTLNNGNTTENVAIFQGSGNNLIIDATEIRLNNPSDETDLNIGKNYINFNNVSGGTELLFSEPTQSNELYFPNESGEIATKEWVSGNTITPNLQEVTDEGSSTSNSITVTDEIYGSTLDYGLLKAFENTGEHIAMIVNGATSGGATNTAIEVEKNGDRLWLTFPDFIGDKEFYFPVDESGGTLATQEWVSDNTVIPSLQEVLDVNNYANSSIFLTDDSSYATSISDTITLEDADSNQNYITNANIQISTSTTGSTSFNVYGIDRNLSGSNYTHLRYQTPTQSNNLLIPNESGILATREWVTDNPPTIQEVIEAGDTLVKVFGVGISATTKFEGGSTVMTDIDGKQMVYQFDKFGIYNGLTGHTWFVFDEPTANNYITVPNKSGVLATIGDFVSLENRTTSTTGTSISFTTPEIYNLPISGITGNITNDLTGARIGVIQKIYHQSSTIPTVPAGWVLLAGEYKINQLNIIYAEWAGSSRVEYWILNEPE